MKKRHPREILSDLFAASVTAPDYYARRSSFLAHIRNNLADVAESLAVFYFCDRYVCWEAELNKTPACDECGEPVLTEAHAFKDYQLCSDKCRNEKIDYEKKIERKRKLDEKRLPSTPLKSCHHCGSAYKSVHKTRCCSDECDRALAEDFNEHGHICIQCETRSPGRSARHYLCESCEDERDSTMRTIAKEKQREKDEEYQKEMEWWGAFRDQQIRNRELQSVKQLTTEQRARLRHYKDLTEAIDKGELVSVACN